jgi:glycosyltransferase involved in cell wall biosynthesis
MYEFHPMITFAPTMSKKLLPQVPFVTRYESAFAGANPAKTSFASRALRKMVVRWAGAADVAYSSGTLLRDSDQVIALCARHRAMLIEESPKVISKVSIIPPPPNIRICRDDRKVARLRGRTKLGVGPDDFVVAFLGYIYPVKGIETLLEALSMVSRERKQVRLLFIGGRSDLDAEVSASYFEKIRTLSQTLGVEDKTIWTGTFSPETDEASLYLYASDACVLPFVQGIQLNNSSLSSVAAHELPIITTRGPMLDEPFVHGENLLLCEPQEPKQLADGIMLLIDDPLLRERLREGVRKLALEWFSWETATSRTLTTLTTATSQ